MDGFPENQCIVEGIESDEELIRDSDRGELDHKYNSKKTYITRSRHCNCVLYNLQHPLAVLSKLALARYNGIRGRIMSMLVW